MKAPFYNHLVTRNIIIPNNVPFDEYAFLPYNGWSGGRMAEDEWQNIARLAKGEIPTRAEFNFPSFCIELTRYIFTNQYEPERLPYVFTDKCFRNIELWLIEASKNESLEQEVFETIRRLREARGTTTNKRSLLSRVLEMTHKHSE